MFTRGDIPFVNELAEELRLPNFGEEYLGVARSRVGVAVALRRVTARATVGGGAALVRGVTHAGVRLGV